MSDIISFDDERQKRKGQLPKASPLPPPPPKSLKQVEADLLFKLELLVRTVDTLSQAIETQRKFLDELIRRLRLKGLI